MAACAERGSLESSTLTWTSVGLTWQTVQKTQTMYIEKLRARSRTIPRLWWDTAGKNAQVWQFSQFGRPTFWLKCRSWRGDCVQKYGDVDFARIPSSHSLETSERGYEETIPPRARGRVNTEHLTVGRQSYSVDLDSFENLVQTRPLGSVDRLMCRTCSVYTTRPTTGVHTAVAGTKPDSIAMPRLMHGCPPCQR